MRGRWVLSIGSALMVFVFACSSAFAARPVIPGEQLIGDTNFLVHFESAASADAATALSSAATAFVHLRDTAGLPLPPGDGSVEPSDPRTDIYLTPASMSCLPEIDPGHATPLASGTGSVPAYIELCMGRFVLPHSFEFAVAHELTHVFHLGVDANEVGGTSNWWAEMLANEMAYSVFPELVGPIAWGNGWAAYGMLCPDASGAGCGNLSQYGWYPFVEYLVNRYGIGVISEIVLRQGALGAGVSSSHARQAVEDVLASKGATLAGLFTDFGTVTAVPRYGFFGGGGVPRVRTDVLSGEGTTHYSMEPWSLRLIQLEAPYKTESVVVSGSSAGTATLSIFRSAAEPGERIEPSYGNGSAFFTIPNTYGIATVAISNASDASSSVDVAQRARVAATIPTVPPTTAPTTWGGLPPIPIRKARLKVLAAKRKGKLVTASGTCSSDLHRKFISVQFKPKKGKKVTKKVRCNKGKWSAKIAVGRHKTGVITAFYRASNGSKVSASKVLGKRKPARKGKQNKRTLRQSFTK